ncbi:hypothetical protein, partial [Fibrobacter intestinalis]|uniref:hypothetical protein n=1 Tax=Fibrobacter intestinalis TaxID=28122 RepID=UPI0023F5156E
MTFFGIFLFCEAQFSLRIIVQREIHRVLRFIFCEAHNKEVHYGFLYEASAQKTRIHFIFIRAFFDFHEYH